MGKFGELRLSTYQKSQDSLKSHKEQITKNYLHEFFHLIFDSIDKPPFNNEAEKCKTKRLRNVNKVGNKKMLSPKNYDFNLEKDLHFKKGIYQY